MPHVPLYVSPEFEGKSTQGLYGDVVQELDWSTGQVVEKLRELGLLENTLVIFSSDNGPWLMMGDHAGSAGQLRDGKGTTFEGGQRVPTVAHWPAQIAPGRVDNSITSLLDLMPTFSAIAGVPVPDDRVIDGVDISGVLTAEQGEGKNPTLQFYYMSSTSTDIIAYRKGDWKLKLPRSGLPKWIDSVLKTDRYAHDLMLFNLKDDPSEAHNIAQQHPDRVIEMQQVITDIEKQIEEEDARDLYMRSTNADRKGYGPLIVKASVMAGLVLLIFITLLVLLYKFIKSKIRSSRAKGH